MAAPTRAEPIGQLRDDVRLLGELVGDVLREQGGPELLADVERLRREAIALRSGNAPTSSAALEAWLEAMDSAHILRLARAFGIYFHLINLAEEHHRIRTLAARRAVSDVLDDSLAAAFRDLGQRRTEAVESIQFWSVFTAHPSEVRRRTLLQHLDNARAVIARLDGLPANGRERANALDELRLIVTLIWQTAETRSSAPNVLDELEHVLYFLAGPVYSVAPRVQRAAEVEAGRELAPLLRFGSWVGGDRDGNPAVTADLTRSAARMARAAILECYARELNELGRELSISAQLVSASAELMASIERDLQELDMRPVARWRDEPYRRKLGLMGERLRRTRNGGPGAYAGPLELLRDLALIRASLLSHRGDRAANGGLAQLRRAVQMFGFHLAEIEIRQHAERHSAAVAEILSVSGHGGFLALSPPERSALLEQRLAQPPLQVPDGALSTATREVLETMRAVGDVQRVDARACSTYIISMCRTPADVLAVLFLAHEANLFSWQPDDDTAQSRIDVVPLFETVAELEAAGDILRALLASKPYRAALQARGNRQQVMVGYSDSNKDAGYLPASFHIYLAQQNIVNALVEAGVDPMVFHGRGGAIARGGGPAGPAIRARAPDARLPLVKATEQGEVIVGRYASSDIAERHLEQVLHATMSSALLDAGLEPQPAWLGLMQELVHDAGKAYASLIRRRDFMEFFTAATPFPELSRLNIASRPVKRSGSAELTLDDLRAIPWGFSWSQSRVNLPAWYGIGSAIQAALDAGHQRELQAMYRDWPFVATTLDNAHVSLATADLTTARRYAALASEGGAHPVFELIEAEYDRSVAGVLAITGQTALLERSSFLARSIQLRNPYVDALHLAQLTLLRRYRGLPAHRSEAARNVLLDAIHHTINGIAAGLQTTG